MKTPPKRYRFNECIVGDDGYDKAYSSAYSIAYFTWNQIKKEGVPWQHINFGMRIMLQAVITAGLRFDLEDFAKISKYFGLEHWAGVDGRNMLGERLLYAVACNNRNDSACRSFEHWTGRKPFKIEGKRICLDRTFLWNGERVRCTSFSADGGYIVVVPARRRGIIKIQRTELLKYERERKAAVKAACKAARHPV